METDPVWMGLSKWYAGAVWLDEDGADERRKAMIRNRKQMPFSRLVICKTVTRHTGGQLDMNGLVDHISVKGDAPQMQVIIINLTIVAGIFTEDKKGAYPARLTLQHPSGWETEMARFSLGMLTDYLWRVRSCFLNSNLSLKACSD